MSYQLLAQNWLRTYQITNDFPRDEVFGLRQMMRKTAIDIPGYIAEGCGKSNDAEFQRSVNAAISLSTKLEYYAIMALDLTFLESDVHAAYEQEIIEVRRMLGGLNRRLES